MPFSTIFIKRAEKDVNRIIKAGLLSAQRIAGRVKARAMEEVRSRVTFDFKKYFAQQFGPLLENVMLAGHLAGFRRAHLIKRQIPSLQRRYDSGELVLASPLEEALKILQARTNLDIDQLQTKYKTSAFKVLNDVSEDVEKELRQTLRELFVSGAHVNEAKEVLGEKLESLGITPTNNAQVETIFRTQLQMTFAAGKWQGEQDEAIQEILWGYKFVTVGDDRVREQHAALDGVTLPKDDPFWRTFYPPNGWNCRCLAIPIFEERKPVAPPEFLENGDKVQPDVGFRFNPGEVFAAL